MATVWEESSYVVETEEGPVRGFIEKTDQRICYKFKGIPYAKPPVGYLRFMPPSPITPWTEILDCTKDPQLPMCFLLQNEISGSEDCLYINISTPNIKPDKPLPVMFWIGGCGFTHTLDYILDPTPINNEDVVFVRCGFRLGPFGFLSINDFTASGNCGLKDVVLALKWVQKNITAFGGDRDNVTIFGNSTGGAIVHFMMLSPMASGLFHKAIIQSASALNSWSLAKNPSYSVLELSKELSIAKTDKIEIVEELKNISAKKIMEATAKLQNKVHNFDNNDGFDVIFKPCIEDEFEGQPAFLTKSPALILKSGNFNKVPLIIGSNNIEGSVCQFIKPNFYEDYKKYNEDVSLLVPKSLAREGKLAKKIGLQLLRFYLNGEESLREDTKNQYLQLISDYYFLYYVNKTVRLHSQHTKECPIYYYIINYAGEWTVPKDLKFFNSLGHFSEIPFIFRIKLLNEPVCKGSKDSVTTRNRVVKMWTNFAKYGNPTPDESDPLLQIIWDPIEDKDKLNYLSIGSELTKGRNPFHERMAFWEKLHKEHTFLRALVYFNDIGLSW